MMESFKYVYMRNRDTKLELNVQQNGTDGEADQYISEVGLMRKEMSKCALITGVTN